MENFFYDNSFCSDMQDLLEIFDIDKDNVNELEEYWKVKVELSNLEPIFTVDEKYICELLADSNEHRLTESFDEEEKILNALKESIDFDKLKSLLPKLHYPNNTYETITKSDLVEYCT